MLVAPIGMVGMGMGNYGIINRFPGIDIKLTFGAVDAAVGKFEEWFFSHLLINL